jgi:hypothetical protein
MVLKWCLMFSSTMKYTPKNLTAGVLDELSTLARGVQKTGSLEPGLLSFAKLRISGSRASLLFENKANCVFSGCKTSLFCRKYVHIF